MPEERRETDPLLGPDAGLYKRFINHPTTNNVINSKVTRFLWLFSLAAFTLSTIILFSAPIALSYLDFSGPKDFEPCEQVKGLYLNHTSTYTTDLFSSLFNGTSKSCLTTGLYNSFKERRDTFMIKFKVKATSVGFKAGNYSQIRLVSLGTTSPRRSLSENRFPKLDVSSATEDSHRSLLLASSILNFHGDKVIINKFLASRETLGTRLNEETEKEYIFEFIGLCRQEISREVFTHKSLRLSHSQKYRIRNWRDDLRTDVGSEKNIEDARPDYELINIVNSGPPENRIDVVFMGDGYTKEERGKFIQDINRLSTEMFEGETFRPWLPIINVWAVFVPSNESGIGTGGIPKDTPYGLYRDGTELRGIYTSKPEVPQSICKHLGPELCDFPSLIANDDFYGGLGGEYIISTRSLHSGTVVLRHEMGHTFDEVGEEYDGGEVYEGVDSAKKLSDIPWKHWLDGQLREEKNNLVFQRYPWHDLTKKGPYVVSFNASGKFPRWYLQISTSGMASEGDFSVTLDGVDLPWKSPGILDRTFSTWFNETHGLSKGSHQLQFQVKKGLPEGQIIHQLCNLELIEYASEKKFNWHDFGHVGAYPTYNYKGKKTYRPTNEFCLMRNMTSPSFCPVCKEGLWLKFLERVSLVDDLDIRLVRFPTFAHSSDIISQPDHSNLNIVNGSDLSCGTNASITRGYAAGYLVQLKLLEVAPLPKDKSSDWDSAYSNNKYKIQWFHESKRIKVLDDQTSFLVYESSPYAVGVWEAQISFSTPQVRKDPSRLLTAHELFILKRPR